MGTLTRLATILTDETHLNPTNLKEEQQKFFNNPSYNPQFTYKQLPFFQEDYHQELERLILTPQDDDKRISTIIQERARELMLWLDLLTERGTRTFTTTSKLLFGQPSQSLVTTAKNILEQQPREEEEQSLTAQELQPLLTKALREEELLDWEVLITSDLTSRAHINPGKKLLKINKEARFSQQDVKKLIAHEIKTHAVRFRNGARQRWEVFQAGTSKYLETEEGLAIYMEEQAGCLTPTTLRRIAGYVIAVHESLYKPFAEVYATLSRYFNKEDAFTFTVRAKRGLEDTSIPGGLTKDYIYLSGYKKIKTLSPEDINHLFIGRISMEHLPIIRELISEGKIILTAENIK